MASLLYAFTLQFHLLDRTNTSIQSHIQSAFAPHPPYGVQQLVQQATWPSSPSALRTVYILWKDSAVIGPCPRNHSPTNRTREASHSVDTVIPRTRASAPWSGSRRMSLPRVSETRLSSSMISAVVAVLYGYNTHMPFPKFARSMSIEWSLQGSTRYAISKSSLFLWSRTLTPDFQLQMYDIRFAPNGIQRKPKPNSHYHTSTRPYLTFLDYSPDVIPDFDVSTELSLLASGMYLFPCSQVEPTDTKPSLGRPQNPTFLPSHWHTRLLTSLKVSIFRSYHLCMFRVE